MKWVLGVLAAIVLLAVAAVLLLPVLVDTPRVQALVADAASQALGRSVRFGGLSVVILPRPAVELRDLEIAEDPSFARDAFVTLERGRLRLRLRPLLTGRLEFAEVVLTRPRISLVQRADGRWNVATLGAVPDGGAPTRPAAGGRPGAAAGGVAALGSRLRIEDGLVTSTARGTAGRYRLEHVDLTLEARGTTLVADGRARLAPGELSVRLSEASLALAGGRPLAAAALAGRLVVEGRDIGALVAAGGTGGPVVSAPVRAVFTLRGTAGAPRAAGPVELAGVTVTRTDPRCGEPARRTLRLGRLTAEAAWDGARATARGVRTSVGGGTLAGNVTVSLAPEVRVAVTDLEVRGVEASAVLVDFLCQGYAVRGPVDLSGALAFRTADVLGSLTGSGRLRVGPGKVVGAQALALLSTAARVGGAASALAGAELSPSLAAAPTEFDAITGTYTAADGVVTTRDLVYASRSLTAAVAGRYALPSGRLDLDVTLRRGQGTLGARVTGTAQAPVVRPTRVPALPGVSSESAAGLGELLKLFQRDRR